MVTVIDFMPVDVLLHMLLSRDCHMALCTFMYPPGQVQFNEVFSHAVPMSMKAKQKHTKPNVFSTVAAILYVFNSRTSKLQLCRPEL